MPTREQAPRTVKQLDSTTKSTARVTAINSDPNDAHDDVHGEAHGQIKCDGHGDLHGVQKASHEKQDNVSRIPAQNIRLFKNYDEVYRSSIAAAPNAAKQESLISKL